jgi:two-component system chemotaxis response regulator CheY
MTLVVSSISRREQRAMKKVLIVDDSAFTRSIHNQIITSAGYQTLEAASGAEAVATFEKEKPDLVVMDLLMPDMDGMDAVRKILEIDADARIVICSVDRQRYRRKEAEEIGAVGFVSKPVNAAEMIELLSDILGDR